MSTTQDKISARIKMAKEKGIHAKAVLVAKTLGEKVDHGPEELSSHVYETELFRVWDSQYTLTIHFRDQLVFDGSCGIQAYIPGPWEEGFEKLWNLAVWISEEVARKPSEEEQRRQASEAFKAELANKWGL